MIQAVRSIPLSRGFVAVVSVEDFAALSKFKWSARYSRITRSWYAARSGYVGGKKTTISMARQILGLQQGNPLQADHRDHDTLNNTRGNLRAATRSQNCMNRRKRSDNMSTFKGVSWNPKFSTKKGMWKVQIWVNGTNKCVGHYSDPVLGAEAYDAKARELYGPFALCNFPAPVAMDHTSQLAEAA